MYEKHRPQWTMTVTIFHGPTFGHAIELVTETKGRPGDNTHDSIGSWHGVGIPAEVLRQATTLLGAAFEEHCIMRYGVQESLEGWEVEPDPF